MNEHHATLPGALEFNDGAPLISSEEKVLAVWPQAEWYVPWEAKVGAIFRSGNEKFGAEHLSPWMTEESAAWDYAASRLK
jgi:hypothetical protein